MNEKVIVLQEPITVGSKIITEITVRKPRMKMIRGLKFGYHEIEGDTIFELACKMTGELPAVIDELGFADSLTLIEVAADFLPQEIMPAGLKKSET